MIEPAADGHSSLLTLKAQPGARRNQLVIDASGQLRAQVTAVPEKGKANAAIIALLSESLYLAKSAIVLVHGETSSIKRFRIQGASEQVRTRLEDFLKGESRR